jgi:small subunit ribosomal protein S10e
VKNLEVWMLMRSMKDKDLVELVFNWQYYYYYLKNEGVKYLRDKLGK